MNNSRQNISHETGGLFPESVSWNYQGNHSEEIGKYSIDDMNALRQSIENAPHLNFIEY